jgi:hypothetical protein
MQGASWSREHGAQGAHFERERGREEKKRKNKSEYKLV